ncbi:MAG TPA: hypothetical protein ENI26_05825 [Methylophaga aminisulfidivorans]|uniref:Uncharacterized protein n=2 Tax=root TaxID=1 RepID=A0A7C1W083_9GAMM|nr:hypothetical protein [Methylophaga aminisulfidivorans]HEC73877.1 hypothetical protein [Methylophaga aminisulfidivorans]
MNTLNTYLSIGALSLASSLSVAVAGETALDKKVAENASNVYETNLQYKTDNPNSFLNSRVLNKDTR